MAQTWAIPQPIRPAPMTPIFRMVIGGVAVMISPICVFQLSSRRRSPFPAPQCFAQSRRRLQGGHEALAPAGYIITAKHVHHVEPSFTTLRKWHVQRLIHRLASTTVDLKLSARLWKEMED